MNKKRLQELSVLITNEFQIPEAENAKLALQTFIDVQVFDDTQFVSALNAANYAISLLPICTVHQNDLIGEIKELLMSETEEVVPEEGDIIKNIEDGKEYIFRKGEFIPYHHVDDIGEDDLLLKAGKQANDVDEFDKVKAAANQTPTKLVDIIGSMTAKPENSTELEDIEIPDDTTEIESDVEEIEISEETTESTTDQTEIETSKEVEIVEEPGDQAETSIIDEASEEIVTSEDAPEETEIAAPEETEITAPEETVTVATTKRRGVKQKQTTETN